MVTITQFLLILIFVGSNRFGMLSDDAIISSKYTFSLLGCLLTKERRIHVKFTQFRYDQTRRRKKQVYRRKRLCDLTVYFASRKPKSHLGSKVHATKYWLEGAAQPLPCVVLWMNDRQYNAVHIKR